MLLITEGGALAWIADNAQADPPRIEVYKADAAGRTMLDASPVVRRGSLRVSGDTVAWVNGNEARTAGTQGSPP
jgi:hypothetical protein